MSNIFMCHILLNHIKLSVLKPSDILEAEEYAKSIGIKPYWQEIAEVKKVIKKSKKASV